MKFKSVYAKWELGRKTEWINGVAVITAKTKLLQTISLSRSS